MTAICYVVFELGFVWYVCSGLVGVTQTIKLYCIILFD